MCDEDLIMDQNGSNFPRSEFPLHYSCTGSRFRISIRSGRSPTRFWIKCFRRLGKLPSNLFVQFLTLLSIFFPLKYLHKYLITSLILLAKYRKDAVVCWNVYLQYVSGLTGLCTPLILALLALSDSYAGN